MKIELSKYDLLLGAFAGSFEATKVHSQGHKDNTPNVSVDVYARKIMGIHAEIAVAKALDCFWAYDAEKFNKPDVGPWNVRSTDIMWGSLIVTPRDVEGKAALFDDSKYVLVLCQRPHFTIAGWAYGRDVKQDKYWRDDVPDPAWFMPQRNLERW